MITTINNKHNKLNFSNEREQSQACLNSAEHEKNQGRKVLNVPNLRFKEFQGEWTTSLLSDYLTENKERNKKGEFDKTDVLSVSGDYGIVNQIELLGRSFAGASVLPYHVVRHGNIVYTKSPLKEYPYGIVKANTDVDGIVSTLYAVYNIKNNVDAQFIEYYFSSANRTNRYFKPIVRIGAKHDMKIGNQEVLANKVTFPNLEEQTKIASLFRFLDERIATQNKIIDKLQSLIKGIRNKLFENDKDWRKAKIREFLCIGNGKDYKHLDFGDIPVYGTGGKMLSVNDFLYDGDSVCIGRKGTIDTPLFLTGKFWTVDTLFYTYGFKDVLPKFCYYLFKQINWQLYNEGTGVPSLSKSTIENIKVRIPSIVQQYKICYILDSYEDKIKNEGLILDLYCSQKQYLLRQMFV